MTGPRDGGVQREDSHPHTHKPREEAQTGASLWPSDEVTEGGSEGITPADVLILDFWPPELRE